MKTKLLPFFFFILFSGLYAQNDLWHKISTVDAGNSVSMAIDSLGYIYNGTSDRGLFQSTDKGLSWQKLNMGFSDPKIKKVRVTPDGSIIAVIYDYGIIISKDNGKSWSQINGSLNAQDVYSISSTSDYLFAGTSKGLFKSSDGGKSWIAESAFSGFEVIEVENLNGTIFCFSIHTASSGLRTKAFSVSSDGGKTWSVTDVSDGGFIYQTASFAYDKNSGKVFCATSYSVYNGIGRPAFASNDNGKTWTGIATQGKLINSFLADPSGTLYAACLGDGIIKSTDWGLSWQNISAGIGNPFVGSIVSDTKGNIYAGTTSGILISNDKGLSWKEVSIGLNNFPIKSFVADNGILYASSRASIYRSKDEGVSWTPIMNGIEAGDYGEIRAVNNHVFIRSYRLSNTWVFTSGYKFNPDSSTWSKANMYADELAEGPNGVLYAFYNDVNSLYTSANLYASKDDGTTWSRIGGAAFPTDKGTFTVDPKGILYLSSFRGLNQPFILIKSTDGGTKWDTTKYNELALTKIKSNSSGYLFVLAGENKIVLSKDGGNTWANINSNLPQVKISDIYIDGKDRVFLLTDISQIFCSYDNGNSWKEVTNNLAGKNIAYIAFSPNADVYAAAKTGEVYKATEASLNMYVSVEKPKNTIEGYSLEQNYPNPFNPKTRIFYSIPHAGNVNISIFDAMGRKVMELVNEYKSEGIFSVDFDGKNFTSGVYFYRISSGSYTDTKKLMLLK